MSFLRNLLADLVARRLWPVAVLLVLALVAVPALLLGGADEPVDPTAAATPAAPVAGGPLITAAAQGGSRGRTRSGLDPFRSPAVPSSAAAGTGGGPGGATDAPGAHPGTGDVSFSTATSGSGSGSGGGAFEPIPGLDEFDVVPIGDGGDLPAPIDGGATPAAGPRDRYAVDLRIATPEKARTLRDLERLSPLPSAADPFFVFLGVLADGETAVFLVSSDAEATGDGTCRPRPDRCERIEMQAGETEFFDFTAPDGEVTQYQLDVQAVRRVRATTTARAAAARTRESEPGREVLRAALDSGEADVSDLAYSREMGLLVPTGKGQERPGAHFGGYRTDLHFGRPGALVWRPGVARLTPLPSKAAPSVVFLGVLDGGDTALFLNPTGAGVSGDGVCHPEPDACQRVALRAGQRTTFDVPTLDGRTVEQVLTVDAITEVDAPTRAAAAAARVRESPAGRRILRDIVAEVDTIISDLGFSAARGTLFEKG